jgi:localization factor PodJL
VVPAGGSADITTAQRGLSRLGYYQGPYDGVNSPALSLAIAAYQRDQGLQSTGALDSTVVQRLSAVAQ